MKAKKKKSRQEQIQRSRTNAALERAHHHLLSTSSSMVTRYFSSARWLIHTNLFRTIVHAPPALYGSRVYISSPFFHFIDTSLPDSFRVTYSKFLTRFCSQAIISLVGCLNRQLYDHSQIKKQDPSSFQVNRKGISPICSIPQRIRLQTNTLLIGNNNPQKNLEAALL